MSKKKEPCWLCGKEVRDQWEEFCEDCKDDFDMAGNAVKHLFKKLCERLREKTNP